MRKLTRADMIVFVVVVGLGSGVISGVRVGDGNQEETLPLIIKAMDSSTYSGDVFVERAPGSIGPRYYFTRLFVALGAIMPVHVAIAAMTYLASLLTAAASFYVAYRLFSGNVPAAMFACLMVMTVSGINLGGACALRSASLVPQTLVMSGAMISLWWAISGRPLSAAVLFAAIGFLHPSLGVQGGMLGLFAGGLAKVTAKPEESGANRWTTAALYLGAMVALGAYAVVVWILPAGGMKLTGDALVTLIDVRIPHHGRPATFPLSDYAQAAGLLVAMVFAWRIWRSREEYDPRSARQVGFLVAVTLGVLVMGYVFVEWIPVRIVVISLVYRMAFILNWLGLTLLGGAAAFLLQRRSAPARVGCAAIVSGCGAYHPLTAALGAAAGALARPGVGAMARPIAFLLGAAGLAVGVLTSTYELRYRFFAGLAMVAVLTIRRPALRRALPLAVLAVLGSGQILMRYESVPMVWRLRGVVIERLICSPWEANKPIDAVATFAKDRLPAEAVFLAPPIEGGRFRTLTHRAVVWDFKFPGYDNVRLAQWRQRMEDCYGRSELTGYDLWKAMDANYHSVSAAQLTAARDRYGAAYAVLYSDTPCPWPQLYRDDTYKLVVLAEERPAPGPRSP